MLNVTYQYKNIRRDMNTEMNMGMNMGTIIHIDIDIDINTILSKLNELKYYSAMN